MIGYCDRRGRPIDRDRFIEHMASDEQRQAMRTRTPRQPSPCGTSGAYRRHNRAGEVCDMCRAAEARRRAETRARA